MLSITASKQRDSCSSRLTVETRIATDHGIFSARIPVSGSANDNDDDEAAASQQDGDRPVCINAAVDRAVNIVNEHLGPALIDAQLALSQLREADDLTTKLLSPASPDEQHSWASVSLSLSVAYARAGAAARNQPLYRFLAERTDQAVGVPALFETVLDGGDLADNGLAFRSFMVVVDGAECPAEAALWVNDVKRCLRTAIIDDNGDSVTANGPFAPSVKGLDQALDLIQASVTAAGLIGKVGIGIDVAADYFCCQDTSTGEYCYDLCYMSPGNGARSACHTQAEMVEVYARLVARYPIVLLKDPFGQDDRVSFRTILPECIQTGVRLISHDSLALSAEDVKAAHASQTCNSLLLAPTRLCTVTEALDA